MFRKNLNFKSAIFKIFIFYIIIYLFALFLRYNNGFENFIIDIEYRYLALINIISIFLGLPLSIVFDFILIKFFGLKYIVFFAPILTALGFAQITLLRKTNLSFSKTISFFVILKPLFTKNELWTLLNLQEELSSIVNVLWAAVDFDILFFVR